MIREVSHVCTVLAVGVGGGCLDIFFFHLSFFFLSLSGRQFNIY